MPPRGAHLGALAAVLSALALAGCSAATPAVDMQGASPEKGRDAIARYGCGACHEIPGVPGARGAVGPPLSAFSKRTMVAGRLANTPDNLTRWIQEPQAIEPGTAMPNLGLCSGEARDIAAYLLTLK